MCTANEIREKFIDAMGTRCQADGLTPIAGRLFGILLFDGKRYAFGELADELGVSRASISTSAQSLVDCGLITRIREPSQRKDFFELANQPYAALMRRTLGNISETLDVVDQTMADLPREADGTIARLGEFAQFYTELKTMSAALIARLDGAPE